MSKPKPCPICGALHNYALMRVMVRLEQALILAVGPKMEEWYLAGHEFLRKHHLTLEGENARCKRLISWRSFLRAFLDSGTK